MSVKASSDKIREKRLSEQEIETIKAVVNKFTEDPVLRDANTGFIKYIFDILISEYNGLTFELTTSFLHDNATEKEKTINKQTKISNLIESIKSNPEVKKRYEISE
jgi:hypothetical protein